jgi:anti-anti-sigma factor
MDLRIIPREDNLTQVALLGRLDITGVHAVDTHFHAATVAQGRSAIVDLSGLEFIASLGIGVLFACARSLHSRGHKMVLVNPQTLVAQSLHTTGVDHLIPIVGTIGEAEALFK